MATGSAERPVVLRMLRAGAALALAVAIVVVMLALIERALRPRIEQHERERRLTPLLELLPRTAFDNDPIADRLLVRDEDLLGTDAPVTVYRARRQATPVAVFMRVTAPGGYGGEISLLIGIAPDGRLLGVRVLSHRETRGLGDAIETARSDWILGFDDRSLGDPPFERWTVRRDGGDFDQFTGATVTPRAVTLAIRNALVYFGRNRATLLAPPR
jgi:Na+-translocating ferredoxin:NAD+ oxidoreductase subunit G